MQDNIRIPPEELKARAVEYRAQANKVQEVIGAMDALLKALMSEWEGKASNAFQERFDELRPGFVAAEDLINEIAKSLDAVARDAEDLDNTIAGQFRG